MPHFQKRGTRIRASDKSLVFRFSAVSLLLLFLAVVLLLNLKTIAATDWNSFHFLQDCFLQALFGEKCKIFLENVASPNWRKLQGLGWQLFCQLHSHCRPYLVVIA